MRSLLVWLCFGIVVLCAISVESVVHILQGQPAPIFRNFIPAIPYGGVGPGLLSNRAQRQEFYYAQNDDDEAEDDDDDDGDEDSEDEEDYGEDGYEGEYYYPVLGSGPDFYQEGEYYDENAEGGEVENVDDKEDIAGRQAYINNQYVERPNIRQSSRPRPQNTNRVPVSNNHRNPSPQPRPTRPSSRPAQQVSRPSSSSRPTKRKPTSAKKGVRQQTVLPVDKQGHREGSVYNKNQGQVNSKQKIQLNPVATSTQFIATPVADLILRLSISLAKPVGRGANSTNLNVPIRIQQIAGSNFLQDDSPKKSSSRPLSEPLKSTTTTTASPVEDDNEEDQEEEEEEREKTAATIVTPLPRN